jgi:hypothetical protein
MRPKSGHFPDSTACDPAMLASVRGLLRVAHHVVLVVLVVSNRAL